MLVKNRSKKNLSKPSELPSRQYFPLYAPNFGNFFNYIDLPEFIDNQLPAEPFNSKEDTENKTKETKYPRPHLSKSKRQELIAKMSLIKNENLFEKYSDIEFYVNGIIDRIIYSKFPISAKTIVLSNLVNINKLESTVETKKHAQNEPLPDNTFGISKLKDEEFLLFESRFESGNLHSAFKAEDETYQLILQNDTNTNGYNQWFFFRVINKEKTTVKFNIINMSQRFSLFNEGMKISVYSESIAKNEKKGWHRGCNKIYFYRNGLYRFIGDSRKNYSSLSFQYSFEYENDTVFFAMNIPFTYTKLNTMLNYYSKNEKKYK